MKVTTLHPFSRDSDIEEEACAWLIKLDADEPFTAAQLTQLRTWLQRSPVHREALNRMSLLWDRMDVLAQLAVPLGHIEPQRSGMHRIRNVLSAIPFRASAAAAAVAMTAGVVLVWFLAQSSPQAPSIAAGFYSTRVGEVVTLVLVDGSSAQLNTNTQVEVRYDDAQRTVRLLEGEAHFEVSHNPDIPFVVYAGRGAVRAVGTAFGVRLMDTEIAVTVTQGRVDLETLDTASPGGAAPSSGKAENHPSAMTRIGSLTAGQTARFGSHRKPIDAVQTLTTPQVAMRLSWREGLLTFAGEPLDEVVADISRYTDMSVVIVDPNIKTVRIGGQFKIGETDALLDVLQTSFGIAVRRIGNERVELSAAGS